VTPEAAVCPRAARPQYQQQQVRERDASAAPPAASSAPPRQLAPDGQRGAQRRTDRDVAAPGGRARQLQDPDVRPGNEQNQHDRGSQSNQGRAHISDDGRSEFFHVSRPPVIVRIAARLPDLRNERLVVAVCLLDRSARRQSRDIKGGRHLVMPRRRIDRKRRVRIRPQTEHFEAARHHRHHLERAAVYLDGLADDRGLAAELLHPEAVAEDDHRVRPRPRVPLIEHPPEQRRRPEGVEQIAGDPRHRKLSRLSRAGERHRPTWRDRGDAREHGGVLPQVQQIHVRLEPSRPHGNEPIGLGVRERLQKNSVNNGENGSVRASGERQRQDAGGSERGTRTGNGMRVSGPEAWRRS
jgi:hypothetical protein